MVEKVTAFPKLSGAEGLRGIGEVDSDIELDFLKGEDKDVVLGELADMEEAEPFLG